MKRSLSLIVLAAICVLALAAVTSLSGCSTKAPDNDPTGSIDSPDPRSRRHRRDGNLHQRLCGHSADHSGGLAVGGGAALGHDHRGHPFLENRQ